jgi:5'/3'-nucleotidase SurE
MIEALSSRGLAAAAVVFMFASPAGAVNILLSNDDGYFAPGIVALKDALVADGHTVTIVAPSGNRSGSSAALTFGPFDVEQIAEDVFSVDSTPANTVKFGAWMLTGEKKPDLVVSGINSGANYGPSTVISGTVGNVIAAIEEIDEPTPGIAFSTDLVDSDVNSAANRKHFKQVAKFGANLVASLIKKGKVEGLKSGQGLNVNYPALDKGEVLGIKMAVQGLTPNFTNEYTKIDDNTYSLASQVVDVKKDVKHSDTLAFQKGYITIVPINGSYTAPKKVSEAIEPYFENLKP